MLKRDARVPSRVAALLRPTPIPPFLLLLLLLLIIINKKRVIVIKHISTQKKEKRDMKKHEIILVFISYTFVYYYFSPISNKNTRIGILFPRNFDTLHTHTHTHTYTRKARTRYTWLHEAVAKTSLYGVASFTSRSTIIILLGKISSSFNLLPLLRPGRGEDWRKEEQTDAVVSPSRSGIQINR